MGESDESRKEPSYRRHEKPSCMVHQVHQSYREGCTHLGAQCRFYEAKGRTKWRDYLSSACWRIPKRVRRKGLAFETQQTICQRSLYGDTCWRGSSRTRWSSSSSSSSEGQLETIQT